MMFNPPHPGEILKELYIKPLNLTISEVAESLGVTRKTLSSLINGRSGISPVMSILLSQAFSNSNPEYWLNLQQQYDLYHVKQITKISHVKVLFSVTNNINTN